MGLSERKVKQKIGADPRNLQWSQDQSRFSYQHLSKFGWTANTGLGGSQSTSNPNHIVVTRKLDSSGIGSERAIREGKEGGGSAGEGLEAVLRRMREAQADREAGRASAEGSDDDEDRVIIVTTPSVSASASPAPNQQQPVASGSGSTTNEEAGDGDDDKVFIPIVTPQPLRVMASRGKYQRSKKLASQNAQAMAEILGIKSSSPSPVPTPTGSGSPFQPSAPSPLGIPESQIPGRSKDLGSTSTSTSGGIAPNGGIGSSSSNNSNSTLVVTEEQKLKDQQQLLSQNKISKSNLSVNDYFRQKMLEKQLIREGKLLPGQDVKELIKQEVRVQEVPEEFEGKRVLFGDDGLVEVKQEEGVVDEVVVKLENVEEDVKPIIPTEQEKEKVKKEKKDKKGKEKAIESEVEVSTDEPSSLVVKEKKSKEERKREKEAKKAAKSVLQGDGEDVVMSDAAPVRSQDKDKKKRKRDDVETVGEGEAGSVVEAEVKKVKKDKKDKKEKKAKA